MAWRDRGDPLPPGWHSKEDPGGKCQVFDDCGGFAPRDCQVLGQTPRGETCKR
jgi:hypothetical protein